MAYASPLRSSKPHRPELLVGESLRKTRRCSSFNCYDPCHPERGRIVIEASFDGMSLFWHL